MTTEQFAEWFSQIDKITIDSFDKDRIYFLCNDENLVPKIIQTAEKTDNFLSLHINKKNDIMFCLHKHKLDTFIDMWEEVKTNKKGVPDLSWVTCRQMSNELKNRENLTFALIWIEDENTENFNIEASGNPTMLCGMFSRGLNMVIKWADKKTKFEDYEEVI